MDQKSLLELYQKLIQGSSNSCELLDCRKLANIKKKFTPSQLAKARFSDEYLELLTDQNSFQTTVNALTYFYIKEAFKFTQRNQTPQYYEFLFEHIFSHSEKIFLDQMVKSQFNKNGNKSSIATSESQKLLHDIKLSQNQKKRTDFDLKGQISGQRHIFFELLESLMWNEETTTEKKAVEKKEKGKDQKQESDSAFSIGKMMSMLI